jgi:hypothetical protein
MVLLKLLSFFGGPTMVPVSFDLEFGNVARRIVIQSGYMVLERPLEDAAK